MPSNWTRPPGQGDANRQTSAGLDDGGISLTGDVQHIFFRSDDGRFAVISVVGSDGVTWRAKGALAAVHVGDVIELQGRVVTDPRFGREIRVEHARPRLPVGREGIVRMLVGLGVRGVARRTAERVVDTLGESALALLQANPDGVLAIRGLGGARGQSLASALRSRLAGLDSDAALADLGLGPAAILRLQARYPKDALLRVRDDPFATVGAVAGLGFRTADTVARALGVAQDDAVRVDAGLAHALDALSRQGHTAPPQSLAVQRACQLLGLPAADVAPAIARAVVAGRVVHAEITAVADAGEDDDDDAGDGNAGHGDAHHNNNATRVGLTRLVRQEAQLAVDLTAIASAGPTPLNAATLQARLALASAELGIELGQTQKDAICAALGSGLHIVTGGPGTGKTTIVRGLLAALRPDGLRFCLAAPTGRAARRLSEATGAAATTLHRLLEFEPRTFTFARNRSNPLDAELVIVDEASMVDVPLAAALADAVAPGGRLVLIGDADQLPSVGPGAVLDDMLGSGVVPSTRLSQVYRQGERSGIVDAAHALLAGHLPAGARDESGDFFVVLRADAVAVAETILEVVTRRLPERYGLDPTTDVAVLVPMHRGAVGTRELNARLGAALNPSGSAVGALSGGGEPLRVGDKVLQTRNNYDLDVFNGDVGVIVGRDGKGVAVRFGDRVVAFDDDAGRDLEAAWAMTVHKAQGSEIPAVVVGLEDAHHVLLERNLLYTAITRARSKVVVVTTPRAFERAVRNTAPRWRATLLGALLRGHVRWVGGEPLLRAAAGPIVGRDLAGRP